jgi:FkbM family methyltransferase
MPRSHQLPKYARHFATYGQNLVHLASNLGQERTPLGIVDVGANIGDSAAQILAKVDARILCIEADPEYLPYLERNVDDRCVIEFALLVTDAAAAAGLGAVRKRGSTHFSTDGTGCAADPLLVSDLPGRHPDLPPIRLIKSDTDGHDTALIPALAQAYPSSRPVLFFEYHPGMTRDAGNDPSAVWPQLAGAGYSFVGIWNNYGEPLQIVPISELPALAGVLELPLAERGYHYWDVAAVHAEDDAGRRALRSLIPS